jgi:hypothetical protein
MPRRSATTLEEEGAVMEETGSLDNASATTFSCPDTCRMSAVNSAT